MALVNCHECNTPISNTAKHCPRCGVKTEYSKRRNRRLLIYLGWIVAIGIVIFGYFSYQEHERQRVMHEIEHEQMMKDLARPSSYDAAINHIEMKLIYNQSLSKDETLELQIILLNLQKNMDEGVPYRQTEFYKNFDSKYSKYF